MNKVIMCIDDESSVLLSLKDQLQNEFGDEYLIEIAESGTDALEIISELKDDGIELELIISDYHMPGMNGDEFLIKAKLLCPNSKKLLLTGQANMEGVSRIINEVGLYRYISKPWEKDDLLVTVKEALKSFETEKELDYYTKNLEEKVKEESAQNKTYLDIIDKYLIASKTDLAGIITDASKAMCEVTGYTKEELLNQKHNIIRHEDMPSEVFKDMWKTIQSGEVWEGELKNKKKDGSFYWVKTRVSPTFDKNDNIIGYASIRVDITDKKRVEELSITDEMTHLYNRRYFNYIIPKELNRALRENKQAGFAIFDVDNFKLYNDNYGHQKGDSVLEKISEQLIAQLNRGGDYGFRLGGEEFGIFLYDTSFEGFEKIIENIRESIYQLNILHNYNESFGRVTASFGGVVFQITEDTTLKSIYQTADELLYFAKENGRNRIEIKNI